MVYELRFLLDFGFINARLDTSLFIFHRDNLTLLLLVYVDDKILTGTSHGFIDQFVTTLANRFSLKDLDALSYFLEVEAISTIEDLFLSQHKYIRDLLHKTNVVGAKEVITPLSSNKSFKLDDGSPSTNPTFYRQNISALQYLSLTRSNISFVVNRLSQFMHRLTLSHYTTMKRVLRYLKHTLFHGLFIRCHSSSIVHAFSDLD